jgi:1,4-dihydroxy-2-naphthoyl-CoA hydrolase
VSTIKKTGTTKVKSAAARMPAKVALPPANRAAIEQSLSVGMGRALHIHLKRLTRKGLAAEMTVSEDHINRSGRINGGIIMSFADVLGAIGTVANLPEGYRTTTLESKTNFFAAGEGAKLKAHTVPLHIGRTTMVWQTTVSNLDGTKVAIVTQTQIVIPKKT